jgi:carbamoyltransferase
LRILGIFDDHNCGCAVIEDGRILAAVEEERLSRIKFHNGTTEDGPPYRSLASVLELTRSDRSNIDAVAIAIQPPGELLKLVLDDLFKAQRIDRWITYSFFSKSIRWDKYFLFYAYWYNWSRIRQVKRLLKQVDLDGIPVELVDHHLAHAASAYYTSGLRDAFVVTLDGQGDGLSGTIYHGEKGSLAKVGDVSSYHSIGLFYNYITWMLGYKPNRHEGKITGLAAYGDPEHTREAYQKLFRMDGPEFRYELAKKVFQHAYPHRSNYPKLLTASNGVLDPYSPADVAAGVQVLSEECTTQWVSHYLKKYLAKRGGEADVCMAGGVFSNVKINQRVAEIEGVRSVYIFPAMMDGGLCVGAALWAYYHRCPGAKADAPKMRLKDVYLGPSYSDNEIEESLKVSGLKYKHYNDIEEVIGALLAKGRVVARFNGRMEYGPRALGNRSILYQSTDPTVNDWLNEKLKRTEFMPFAPSSLFEDAGKLYHRIKNNTFPAEYMTITFDCTPRMSKACPATVHVDGTARPQLVTREINESYYRILKNYKRKTGLSTFINTSFNMHEEPIVCTPGDAIRAFKLGHLDFMAMSNFLVYPEGEGKEI